MCSDYLLLQYVGLHMSQLEVQLKGTAFTKDAFVSCKILGGVNLLGTLETDMWVCMWQSIIQKHTSIHQV